MQVILFLFSFFFFLEGTVKQEFPLIQLHIFSIRASLFMQMQLCSCFLSKKENKKQNKQLEIYFQRTKLIQCNARNCKPISLLFAISPASSSSSSSSLIPCKQHQDRQVGKNKDTNRNHTACYMLMLNQTNLQNKNSALTCLFQLCRRDL